jgi:uncharacterized protein
MVEIAILFSVIAIITMLAAFGNNRLAVSEYRLDIQGLPDEFEGFKIAQFSDLHNKRFGRKQRRIIRKITNLKPDICVFTGDLVISYQKSARNAIALIQQLSNNWPTYFITGNHEAHNRNWTIIKDAVIEAGGRLLIQPEKITRKDSFLWIIGIDDPSMFSYRKSEAIAKFRQNLNEMVQSTGDSIPSILLSHRPELLGTYSSLGVDVVLSGHAHGGLWQLPFVGGLFAPNQGFFPTIYKGMHKRNKTTMIVSRGLGAAKIPLRILNPPELVLIRLFR